MEPKKTFHCSHSSKLNVLANEGESATVWHSLDDIKDSARSGCHFCSVLSFLVEKYADDEQSPTWNEVTLQRRKNILEVFILPPFGSYTLQCEIFTRDGPAHDNIPNSTTLTDTTSSQEALEKAVRWYSSCLSSHGSLCNAVSEESNRLPTRILDIKGGPNGDIILKETREVEVEVEVTYACLSHCWGGSQPIQTTKGNLSTRMAGIPWHSLPRTFQDVIDVVRRLGLQYLWIDCLCIVQDDTNDWLYESSRMGTVYRNASITIAAAAASTPHDGLFATPEPEHREVEVLHPLRSPDVPKVYARKHIWHLKSKHPLLKRAWVFQERLLSPRVLHFGIHELLWECMENYECECGGFDLSDKSRYNRYWFERKANFHPKVLSSLAVNDMQMIWREIIGDYTGMRLTVPSDILPAISGAADIIAKCLAEQGVRSTYLAGMWSHCFINDCLWRPHELWIGGEVPEVRRPATYRGPTFSWTSVQCFENEKIGYIPAICLNRDKRYLDEATIRRHASLGSFEYNTVDENPLGPVKSASVTLTGPLLTGTLCYMYGGSSEVIVHGQRFRRKHTTFSADYNIRVPGSFQVEHQSEVKCLMLLEEILDMHLVWCLVLRPIEKNGEAVFERIGILEFGRNKLEYRVEPLDEWFDEGTVQHGAVVKIV